MAVNHLTLLNLPVLRKGLFVLEATMIVYLSDKLDDINLSPEAFRLYIYLRCQAAKAIGNSCSAESLILSTRLGRVLERLGLPADSLAVLELERRRIVSFSYDWEERETRIVFHHEGMWQ